MASSSLDMDLSRLSLGGGSPFANNSSSQSQSQTPHSYAQPNQQPPQMVGQQGGLQPHQIMQPPVHSGPPPHVQLQEPQRRRGVVKFFSKSSLYSLVFSYIQADSFDGLRSNRQLEGFRIRC